MTFLIRQANNQFAVIDAAAAGGRETIRVGGFVIPLIGPGAIFSPATFARAQVGSLSTSLGSDAATWAEFNADVPRYYSTGQPLLIEGQRTDAMRNPRFEGAVPGSPGTLPTYAQANAFGGITPAVAGVGTEFGLPYIDMLLLGTATSTQNAGLNFEQINFIPATLGETWTSSHFVRVVGGDKATLNVLRNNVVGTNGASNTESSNINILTTVDGTLRRFQTTRTLNNAGTTFVRPTIEWGVLNGAAVNCTLRVYAPQIEQAPFASTPILPPIGAPGASTRGADILSAAAASLGIAATGACTILWKGVIPQNAPAGVDQVLASLTDGTANNVIALMNAAGGATIVARRVTAGVGSSSASAGSMTAGTTFRAGISCDGAGRVAACFNGGAIQAVTGAPVAGFNLFSGGALPAGQNSGHALHELLRVVPAGVSDAALQSLVSSLP